MLFRGTRDEFRTQARPGYETTRPPGDETKPGALRDLDTILRMGDGVVMIKNGIDSMMKATSVYFKFYCGMRRCQRAFSGFTGLWNKVSLYSGLHTFCSLSGIS